MAQKKSGLGNKNDKEKSWKRKSINLIFKAVAISIGAVFLFILLVYLGLFGRLPGKEELSRIENDVASEIYASDGTLMGKYYYQNRMSIDNKVIAECVKNALVATEDQRFFEHKGFDIVSLGRVIFKTLLLRDKAQGGGSTISQQLAKNIYPRKDYGIFSMLVNKLREIFIASRLEQEYSKNDILKLYLNTVPFGEGVYGIEAAAQRFFSKHSSELEPQEAAVLIGMLAANTAYNPRLYPDKSMRRRNIVLSRMGDRGFLSKKETEELKKTGLGLKYNRIDQNTGIAPYFREIVRKEAEGVLKDLYGDNYNLYRDGLKLYTTINPTLQQYANEAVNEYMSKLQTEFKKHWWNKDPWKDNPAVFERALKSSDRYKNLRAKGKTDAEIREEMKKLRRMTIFAYPEEKEVTLSPLDSIRHYLKILNTGLLVSDPHSGYVLAWVGGVNHKYFQYDHVISKRQVGSTFKPIVYTAAIRDGVSPCEFISNERRIYSQYKDWSPENADGNHLGYYSVKGGLAHSVNTITAELMVRTGVDKVLELAQEMGVKSNIPAVPSISLGTGEISLREMLTVYSCFANMGSPSHPIGLLRIEDKKGNVLYEYKPKDDQVQPIDAEIANILNHMLMGVVDRGTAKNLKIVYGVKGEWAGKTGTTQDNADGWFIGYNQNLLAGAWVGAESPVVHFRSTALGQGAHMAMPIVATFLRKLQSKGRFPQYADAPFPPLPEEKLAQFDCEDYLLDDPDKSIFDIFKLGDNKLDSVRLRKLRAREEERRLREKEREERDEKRDGLLKRMRDLFKRK